MNGRSTGSTPWRARYGKYCSTRSRFEGASVGYGTTNRTFTDQTSPGGQIIGRRGAEPGHRSFETLLEGDRRVVTEQRLSLGDVGQRVQDVAWPGGVKDWLKGRSQDCVERVDKVEQG